MTMLPPLALTVLPVIHLAPSLAKKATTCAISSGVPLRGAAAVDFAFAARRTTFTSSDIEAIKSVSTMPIATPVTS
jgi:hypothetical protein